MIDFESIQNNALLHGTGFLTVYYIHCNFIAYICSFRPKCRI